MKNEQFEVKPCVITEVESRIIKLIAVIAIQQAITEATLSENNQKREGGV